MKIIYTLILTIFILSLVSGCQESEETMEIPEGEMGSSRGEIRLDIINLNKYASIHGISGPTGKVGYINRDETYYVRLLEKFSMPDEGDIYIYISEKTYLENADDLKEDAYEVSILTAKEGNQEYRVDDSVPTDKIDSVAFYNKEENILVAWAVFE